MDNNDWSYTATPSQTFIAVSPQRVCYRKMVLNFDVPSVIQLDAKWWHLISLCPQWVTLWFPAIFTLKAYHVSRPLMREGTQFMWKCFNAGGFYVHLTLNIYWKTKVYREREKKRRDKKVNTLLKSTPVNKQYKTKHKNVCWKTFHQKKK